MAKTILLIARHYPPHVSGAARRLRGLAEALRAEGARVFVLAPDLPEGEDGMRVPHPQPTPATGPEGSISLAERGKRVLRPWLLWPDADIRWAKRAAVTFLEAQPCRPDWVISSSPPESVHVAGRQIARETGALWAADFRDLWLERPLWQARNNPLRRMIERRMAGALCKDANLLFGVDDSIVAEVNGFAGQVRAHALPHFAPPLPEKVWDWDGGNSETIRLVHTGSFSLSDPERTIDQLIEPFAKAAALRPALELHLVGRLTEAERETVRASQATAQIILHGVKPFEDSLAMQASADGLVLVGSPRSAVPPGKFVEYRALGKPVIIAGTARWRGDIHPGGEDVATLLVKLADGARVNAPLTQPPSAKESALHLIEWMDGKH